MAMGEVFPVEKILRVLCVLAMSVVAVDVSLPCMARDEGREDGVAWGSTQRVEGISREPFVLKPGVRLLYEAWSIVQVFAPPVREDFEVTMRDVWPGGVSFSYSVTQKVIGESTGIQTLSSLDDCAKIDPWWEPSATDFDDRCELWISKKSYCEMKATGKTWISVDTLVRRDTIVRWEREKEVRYLCTLDGRPVLLNALSVKTSRGDEFVVLDDEQNPLILSAKTTAFSWSLREIATGR